MVRFNGIACSNVFVIWKKAEWILCFCTQEKKKLIGGWNNPLILSGKQTIVALMVYVSMLLAHRHSYQRLIVHPDTWNDREETCSLLYKAWAVANCPGDVWFGSGHEKRGERRVYLSFFISSLLWVAAPSGANCMSAQSAGIRFGASSDSQWLCLTHSTASNNTRLRMTLIAGR